jgi:hypothetical protein
MTLRRYTPDELAQLGERLWRRVRKSDGCWEWTGGVMGSGYGQLRQAGRSIGTHRLAYLLLVGSIPDGLCVCHTCDNPRCVRPDHLWLGTNRDNQLDARAKGRSAIGERNSRALLTAEQADAIRVRVDAGESPTALSREFHVSRAAVQAIRSRRNWRPAA